ncbi:Cellulose synthase-like protein D3, partial [Ananas comosus]
GDPTKNKRRSDFVKDRRKVKREYDEFKVRINGLPDSIRRRSEAFNAREDMKMLKHMRETGADPMEQPKVPKATWMADGTHWPGTWAVGYAEATVGDPLYGLPEEEQMIDFSDVDIRLPMMVYMSREKRPASRHNKKAGAMNALVRASAIMSNGPFILNSTATPTSTTARHPRGDVLHVGPRRGSHLLHSVPAAVRGHRPLRPLRQPQHRLLDGNMRASDGLQGRCTSGQDACSGGSHSTASTPEGDGVFGSVHEEAEEGHVQGPRSGDAIAESGRLRQRARHRPSAQALWQLCRACRVDTIAEFQGRPLADPLGSSTGAPGALTVPRPPLDPSPSLRPSPSYLLLSRKQQSYYYIILMKLPRCDRIQVRGQDGVGERVGWIYGSVTEDVVTGYRMHNRGWRSVYCITKRDAFRGSAPINLTDRLHQVLRWATGSVEIFFSRNNAFLASSRLKFLQRIAYLNVGIYPFTSIFLLVYCFLPALSLFSGKFIVQTLNVTFLVYLLTITVTLILLAILEVKWSGVGLEEWWRNEQFWLISGTSAHLYAVVQGLLKVVAGIEISFTLTSKSSGEDNEDIYADLYIVKWSSLMIPPITIMMVNIIAIAFAFARTIYSQVPQWSKLIGGGFFSFWVLAHLYPFAKGLMGRRGKTPTIVFVWSGLIAITISLLWIAINPPKAGGGVVGGAGAGGGGGFQFP